MGRRACSRSWATLTAAVVLCPCVLCAVTSAQDVALTPPQVLVSVPPVYPDAQLASGAQPTVVVKLTVQADGSPSDPVVEQTAGDDFDEAARACVGAWLFAPAQRGDDSIASRIAVEVSFTLPELVPAAIDSETPDEYGAQATVAVELRAGASDFQIQVGALRVVPRANASDFLKLAPGILLTNEGGEGHAEQVYLRGFDARDGQDLEFSVDGVPINDSGNIHGNGYADTHFIIPELIESLHVIEGPFSPRQGNYAVAGSADYHLGLAMPGVTSKLSYGSWNTRRALLMWAPDDARTASGTFVAAELNETDGFGQNRAARRASAMAQYEAKFGRTVLRVGTQAYATHFRSAGVVRQDDWTSGRVGFFGTEDPRQGGDAARFSVYGSVERRGDTLDLSQSVFLIRRDMRLREDFTGFLLDTQDALDTLHPQRGDLLDTHFDAFTLGARGTASTRARWWGLQQEAELGYFARLDLTDASQYRNSSPSDIPYRVDNDLSSTLTDLGMFAELTFRPLWFVTLRAGARLDAFGYDVFNHCAAQGDIDNPSRSDPPTNQSCHDQLAYGAHREPVQRSSTGAIKLMPRANLVLGPFRDLNFTASVGEGVRSIDPIYISQDLATPFASIRAVDAGAAYSHAFDRLDVSARSIYFDTHVDHDLIFSQTAGRNVLANGTTRRGWAGSLRIHHAHVDSATSLTYARPRFDDTHLPIPYAPTLVFREDAALFGTLPWQLWGAAVESTLGVGYSFIGPRALPYGEHSNVISVLDASASLGYRGFSLTLSSTNLLDQRYHLGEYNYASDFHSAAQPTLVPARHFTAGAPRGLFVSLSKNWGSS